MVVTCKLINHNVIVSCHAQSTAQSIVGNLCPLTCAIPKKESQTLTLKENAILSKESEKQKIVAHGQEMALIIEGVII